MIIDYVFSLLSAAIKAVIGLLPTGSYDPSPWASPLSAVMGAYKAFSGELPVTAVLAAIAFALVVTNALLVWRLANFVIKHIPFVGGGG